MAFRSAWPYCSIRSLNSASFSGRIRKYRPGFHGVHGSQKRPHVAFPLLRQRKGPLPACGQARLFPQGVVTWLMVCRGKRYWSQICFCVQYPFSRMLYITSISL